MEKQVKQSQETNSCSVGCKDCNYNSQCLQCMDGFDLYQNNCIFQNCLEGLFFYEGMQNQNQTLGTCVAVCPQQYIQSFSQNTCNRIESCTLSYSTEIKKDQCIINELKQLPQDLKQFLLKEQEFNIIQFMNSISIIDNQLVEIQSLTFSPQAILKLIIVSNLDETYIIFLLDNYFVQQVQLQIVSQGLQLQQVNQIPVLTSNPKYLIYLPAITQQNISDRLLIIGNDIQSEILISKNKTQNTEKQRYIVSNSNFQYEDFKSQIQFTLIIDNINIMVNCVNQAIYIWDISEIYNPVYIFSIKNSNSQCLEIYYLSNYDILIVYQNQINVFQINKFYLKQLWNLNSTSQGFIPKVSIYQQKCAIVFNQALYLYELDSERLIPFQFSNYTEHIQFISLQNNNLLIIQYQQQCSQFYINYQTNTTQLIKKFQTNSQIIKSKIRTYANNTFELNIYTSINSFIILNQDFTLILQIQKIPFLQLFDFSFLESDPTDNSYFLLGQTTQVSASSQYIGYYFTKSIPTLTQAWSATSGIKIINVEKLQSNLLQTTYIAQVLFNQNAYSAIFSFIYQPSKPKLNVGNFYFNFYQYQYLQENTYLTNQKQNLISCDVNGLIGVNQNTRSFYNILYSMSSSELQVQKNPIMDVIQNYNLGIVLVVKSLNILQFDIFTNQLIKNIQFGISNSTIIQYQLYKSKSSFISCKTDTLYLQLIDLKKEYTFQTQLLNGFTLWKQDNQDFIITYGQSITILSFELQVIQNIQDIQINQTFYKCKLSGSLLFCSIIQNQKTIVIINLIEKQIQQYLTAQYQFSPINFSLDDLNNILFIYSQSIECYNFNGVLINLITNILSQITDIVFYKQQMIVLQSSTQSYISFYERSSFTFQKQFAFQKLGNILSFKIVKQNNQMLISTQGAQIYIYDILQQSLITIISSQSQSTQGSIYVGMYFDQEFYQITTLSQSGVLYSLSYQNFQSPQQLTKYIEFDTAQTPYAKGMYVDQITNLCFLFSDQYVLKADYSRFTNIFKQLSLEKNKFATKIIYLNQNNYAYYILTGQNNTLYTYQNFQIQYFGLIQSQNQIVDIQYLEDNQLVIVAFIQEIRVYNFTQVKFQSNSLIENMPYQQEIQFQINQFLCPYIFITIDNIVVHYDFKSMEVIQKLALSSILSKFYINKQKSILTLGLSNGDIILYFIQTQQQLNYSLNIASNKNNIKFILETNKYIWIGSLNSYLICFDVINNKQQFQINLNTYSNNTLSELTALAIDEDNTRLFFGYLHQKIVYSLNYSTINSTQNQKYLLFPGTQSNNIEITQNYIIIYSTFQFNFHDRSSLQFILTVRRQNIADAVNKIYIVKEQFFLLFSTYKYELIFIDFQNQNYQILDQVQINHYQIIDIVYSENENRLNLITTINNQLYEKNYQLSYYLQQIIQNKYECSLVFQDATYFQMTNKVNSIYPIVQQQSNTLGINILQNINSTKVISSQINNPDFSEINLQLLKSSQLIITPNSNISAKQELIITEELFANYPLTSIQLNNFNFIIKGNLINFDSNISEVFLQNIEISNQNLSNVQIILNNLDKVVIQNLIVQNITISQLQNSQSFLIFENCNLVTIQNLTIQNMKFYGKNSSYFFSIKNIKRSNIQNIIIKNSNLNNSFMFLQELQVIKLNQIEVNQCKNENNQTDINYFITSQGIQTFLINSAQFLNNQNILFISYRNQYILDFQKYQIQDDQIIMQVSNVSKNSCIDKSLQLIKIQAANVIMNFLQFNKNEINIACINCESLQIMNSLFTQNQGINGGAFFVQNNTKYLKLQNSTFIQNIALASGGALFLIEQNGLFDIDNLTLIEQNKAQIGGGLKIQNSVLNTTPTKLIEQMKKINFKNNKAIIFGQNYQLGCHSLQIEQISRLSQEQEQKIQFFYNDLKKQSLSSESQYLGTLFITNLKSGENIKIAVSIIDEEGNKFILSQDSFLNKNLMSELNQFTFQLQSVSEQKLQLNGQTLINIDSYDFNSDQFLFNQVIITSSPNTQNYLLMNYQINSHIQFPILIQVQFRNCKQGEVLKHQIFQLYSCQECQIGTYSLAKYDNQNTTNQTILSQYQQTCNKCPNQADFCQGNNIQLKFGYWRESDLDLDDDQISYCQNNPQNCQEQYPNQIKGCIDGYIGPLCETCDSFGDIWNQRYTKTFTSKYKQMLLLETNVYSTNIQELSQRLYQLILKNIDKLLIDSIIHFKFEIKQCLGICFNQLRSFLKPIISASKFIRLSDKLFCNQQSRKDEVQSNFRNSNDIKISLLTIQNSFLTQSKLSNSPITPNRTAFSHVLTNSVYHLQKKQTLKSHFGTTNQAKEQKANLRDEYNFVTQNTQIQDTQYMFNRNNTNEIVFPNQNFKESEQYQENHLKEQNQFQEWLIPIYHNTLQTRKSQQNQNNNKQMNSQWFKNWILKQIISLALIRISVNQLSQFNQNCGLGCMECIKSFNCIKCIQGYQLQQGVCAYSNCPQGMFYQLDSNNLNKNIGQCVAICNNSYYQCTSQNSCFKVEQCPLSFQSEFIFNDGELNIQERLLIVGEGIQSVILSNIYNNTINTEKQQYLIQNYEFSFDQISGLIQNTLVIDQINYLVSCAAEGVFVWDISHIYKFKYLFSIKQNDAQCLELYHLQNYDILITYNSKILILNLSQFIIKQEWAINQIYQSTIPKISVQSSFILPEDQLLIQLVNEILLYQLDLNTFNSEAKFYFMTQANILMTKIRYYSQQYFEVNIYTQDQSFIILNQQLQIILLINKIPLLSLNDFQFMNNTNDDSYYFLGKTSQINSSFSTVVLCIFKSDPQIYLAIQTTGGQQIVSIQQQLNNSSVFYYLITLLINKPTYSSVIQFQYFPKTKTFYFYNGFYQLNKNQQLSYFVNRNQNQISTFSNGFIGSHQNMQFFQQQIYISKDQNMVVDIIQNYKMGITFVIKQSSFVVFNLFTNILIEEVFFGNQEDMIINYYFIQENNVFTACKKDVLITKDYHTYNNNNTQQIDIINGYIVYRVSNQSYLIAYGQQIQLFNLNLTLIHTILNQQEGLIISSCKEISSNLYCKAQQQQGTKPLLIIFDLINYQILQKILSIDSDSNFQFQVDLENQNIFIFKDYLQIFSFQGQQVEKISNFKEEISSLDLYGQYIILLQSSSQSYITIFDRKTFLFVHEFVIQTQGYIVCNLIVEQYNHLLISIDNIQMGQIFVYDLSKMTFVTSIFNYFPSNNPNIVQSLIYDKDFNLLNFLDKTGINGGALFIENNSKQINILNSRFLGNTAKANGGAIYFKEQQGIINIDKYCSIKYNHAQIGGGFRIQNSDFYLYSYELLGLVQQLDISNNTADISGQNYKFGLSSIEVVSISSDSSDNQPIQYYFKNNQNINQDQYSGQLNILSLKSGVKLNIALGLKDEENNLLVFKTDTYKSNQYQTDIQNELSQISFSLQSINQQQIQLEGQITILTDSFQSEINSFVFNQVTISGQPLGFGCQYCQLGFYSLESFNNYNISYISSQSIQPSCQQCPASADQCQKSTILIKQGYWRIGKHSDKIILCINNPLNCQEQDVSSINGCIQGYIGPLCEECDIFGVIWQKRYTKKSFSQYECTLCPSLTGQIVYISGVIIFVIVYGLITTQISQSKQICGLGCSDCNSQFNCLSCIEDFQLENGICQYSKCIQGLFYQQDSSKQNRNLGKCVAICENNYYQSVNQSSCIKVEQCPLSFSSESVFSDGGMFKDLFQYQNNTIIILRSNQIFQIQRQNGQFLQQFSIPKNLLSVYVFQNLVIAVRQDFALVQWDLNQNQIYYLNQIQLSLKQGQNPVIYCLSNSYLIGYNIQMEKNLIEIQFLLFYQSQIPKNNNVYQYYINNNNNNNQQAQIIGSIIILINQIGIRLDLITINSNSNLEIIYFTNKNFLCNQSINTQITQILQSNLTEQQYNFIAENNYNVYTMTQNSCLAFKLNQIPQNLNQVQLDNVEYFIIQFQNQIQLIDSKFNNSQVFNFSKTSIIQIVIIKQQLPILLILLSNQQIQYLQLQNVNNQLKIQNIKQIQVLVDNPSLLYYLPAINETNTSERLFIIGQTIQSDLIQLSDDQTLNSEKKQYIIQNYKFSYDKIQSQINYTLIVDEFNLALTCSSEGIFVWDISHIYEFKTLFSIKSDGDQCLEIYHLQNQDILISFVGKILILNLKNFQIKQNWEINLNFQNFTTKISISQTICALIYNQSLFVYDYQSNQINQINFNMYSNQIKFISLLPQNGLLVQTANIFQLFYLNLEMYSSNLFTSFQTKANIVMTKVRQYSQSQFEINVYFSNQSFVILNQQLQKILEVNNIPLLSLTDFSYMEDPSDDSYFFLGKTNQINSSNSVVVLCTFKSDPQIFQAIQISSGQQIVNIKKEIDSFSNSYYIVNVLFNKATYCSITQFQYYPKSTIFYFYNTFYQYNQIQQKVQFANQNKNMISSFQSGFFGSNQNIQFFQKQFYSLANNQDVQNIIIDVIQNYKIGLIFVIKQNSFVIFNIYNNDLVKEVAFGNLNDPIIKYQVIQDDQLFVVCKRNIITVYQYKIGLNNTLQLDLINGFLGYNLLDQTYIAIYGQEINFYDVNLNFISSVQNQSEDYIIEFCKQIGELLFCQTFSDRQTLIIINLLNYEIQLNIYSKKILSSFNFQIDEENQNIYLFQNSVQIYSFEGLLVSEISNLKENVTDLLFFGDQVILIQSSTQSYVTIYDRNFFSFVHEFIIQTQGFITCSLLVEQYGHLLISTDNILMAQIYVYDLNQKIFVINILSSFPSNNPNVVVSLIFDKDYNQLNFLDKTGNIYSIIYTNLQSVSFLVKFYQFNTPQLPLAKGMSIDFITNSCFVFSDTQLFYINYSQVTSFFIQQQVDSNNFFTKVTFKKQNQLYQSIYYLMLGQNNTIYLYSNYTILYLGLILNNLQAIDIQYFDFSRYLIIAFQHEIRIYDFTQALLNFNSYSLNLSQSKNSIKFIQETESFIWIGSLNGYLIGLNSTYYQQVYKINLNQISNNTDISEVTSMSIDEQNTRIFFSYLNQNIVYCYNYSTLQTINDFQLLKFPGSQYNRVEITQNFLILYSTFQLNIHNRQSLEYVINIRRQNLYDSINKIFIVQEQFYLLFFNNKLELFYIDIYNQQTYLLDQVQIINLKIIDIIYDQNIQNLMVILATQNQIFEQNYSLNYYLKKIYLNQFECNLVVGGQSFFEIQKQIQSIQPFSWQQSTQLGMNYLQNLPTKNMINFQISTKDFSEISFSQLSQNILSINPYNYQQSSLVITQNLFLNYPHNQLQLANFSFIINDKNITFNQNLQIIYLQNVKITDQKLYDVQFLFQDIDQVIIQDIIIQNLNIINEEENLPFFSFVNCRVVTINNLTVQNINFVSQQQTYLFQMKQITNLNILQIKVQQSSFSCFFDLEDIQFVNLNTFYIDDCRNSQQSIEGYFIYGSLFYNTNINQVIFINNNNIQFINYNNTSTNLNLSYQLNQDQISIQNCQFQYNQITNQSQSLIDLQANQIIMSNLTYLNNTANIHLTKVQNILIFNSEFINNTGINGGALFIQNNSIYFNISNSTFQGNLAKASGGAIYFKEQLGIINIDKFCSVKYNQAMIGGGLRIQNSNLYEYSSQLLNQVQLLDIRNNTADLFSQNYYLGLSRVDIISINSVSQDNLPIEFNFKQNLEQDLYSGQLNLLNLNSGDKLNITIGIMDEEKNFLEFNTNMFRNNQYQTDIQNELSQFSFSLQPIDQQQIQLEGQINIHSDSYESVIKSFVFNQISILGSPLGVGNCILGEQFKHLIFNIYSCQYCQIGSYSLQDYSKNYNSADQETNNCMMNIINQKSSDILDVKKEVESLESISTIFEKLNNKGYVKQLSDFLDHLIFEELNFTHAELQKIMMNLANQKNLNFNEQFQINCNIFKTCFFQIINIIVQKSWQKQYGALQLTSVPSIQQIQDKIENVSIHENQKNDCGGQQNLENEKSKEQQIKENNQKLDQYQIYKISNLSQLYKSDQLEQIISVGAISSEESVYQISQSKIQIDPAKESHQNTLSNTTNATAFESLSECKDSRRRTKSSINPKEYIRQLAKSDQKLSLLLNINEYDKTHMFKKILEKHKQNLVYSPNQQQTVRNSVMRSSFFSPSHSYNKKEDLFIINLSEFGQSNTKLKQSLSISERRSNVNQIKQTPSPCDYDVKKSEKFVRPNSPTQVFSKSPRQSWIDLQTKKEGAYQNQSQNKHDTKKSNLSVKKITSNYGVK
ncbi:hypothetical protein ABPG74_007499 [Tetrahymena malaccensis]